MVFLKLFFVFSKIGLFGFGGGLAMLPMIYQGAMEFGLMEPGEFANLVGISQMTPGPLAVNAATYVGYTSSGVLGAVVATLGEAVPAFVLMSLACYFITKFKESKIIQGSFTGIRPVTVGLLGSAVIMMGKTVFVSLAPAPIIIAAASFFCAWKLKLSPIWIILGAAAAGAVFCSGVI